MMGHLLHFVELIDDHRGGLGCIAASAMHDLAEPAGGLPDAWSILPPFCAPHYVTPTRLCETNGNINGLWSDGRFKRGMR
jgi:hypothetical protein